MCAHNITYACVCTCVLYTSNRGGTKGTITVLKKEITVYLEKSMDPAQQMLSLC